MEHSETYRQNSALGGTDTSRMVSDYGAWLFERRLKDAGKLPPWMKKETSAMSLGTAIHMALLEPHKFEALAFPVEYHPSYATKEGRAAMKEAKEKAEHAGGFVLKPEEAFCIQTLRGHWLEELIPVPEPENVEIEHYRTWEGVELKGKLDWVQENEVLDLKTTRDIKKTRFSMRDYRYDCQLAHYRYIAGYERATIIWLETEPPYRVEVQRLSPDMLDQSFSECCEVWARWRHEPH